MTLSVFCVDGVGSPLFHRHGTQLVSNCHRSGLQTNSLQSGRAGSFGGRCSDTAAPRSTDKMRRDAARRSCLRRAAARRPSSFTACARSHHEDGPCSERDRLPSKSPAVPPLPSAAAAGEPLTRALSGGQSRRVARTTCKTHQRRRLSAGCVYLSGYRRLQRRRRGCSRLGRNTS